MSKKSKAVQFDVNQALGELERLARLVRAASHAQGLTPAQWDILRFLSRANRFSNSPIAVSNYVGATKGTTSQSIASLVKKGLILKTKRMGDERSVVLLLSEQGLLTLKRDPLLPLRNAISLLSSKTQKRFAKGVTELLQSEHKRQGQPSFGSCGDCRFYRSNPHYCMKIDVVLEAVELPQICIEHLKR